MPCCDTSKEVAGPCQRCSQEQPCFSCQEDNCRLRLAAVDMPYCTPWGYNGIMENKMETSIVRLYGFIFGLYGDNGKENGNYRDYALMHSILGLWHPVPS